MKRLVAISVAAACAAPVQETKAPPAPAPVAQPAPPTAPAPTGPQPMSREGFKAFVHALDMEAGDDAKLGLLRSASASNWYTAAMAGVIVDHVVHRENKLLAVPIVKDRILDRENAFWLYEHFTYREDKAKVQEMLGH
jgi:hypothetical protein